MYDGVANMVFSGLSTIQREKWVHVGAGQGSYSKTGCELQNV